MTTEFAAQERLSEYLDGELSGDELTRMEAALDADPAFRPELEELRALIGDLGSLPEVQAPAGLLGAVLASTADLAIGLDVGEAVAESGQFAAALPPPISTAANVAFWKTPWFGAVAAVLVLGVGVMFSMQGTSQPESSMAPPSPMAFEAAPDGSSVPSPSGALVDADAGDAVVDAGIGAEAEEAARERLADRLAGEREPEPEPLMEAATPRVMNGVTAPTEAPAPASRPVPRRSQPDSAVGPDGVFEAEWEGGEDSVAMEEELEAEAREPSIGSVGFAPEPPSGLAEDDAAALADDVTMADEPLEDYLDPAADVPSRSRRSESAPAATGAMRRGDSGGSGRVADSSVASKSGGGAPPSLDEVTFTGAGGDGTLRLAPGVTPEMAITALRGNGVTVDTISASSSTRVLQLTVAESGAANMSQVLRQHGALQYGRAPQASEGQVSLRLTMRSAAE